VPPQPEAVRIELASDTDEAGFRAAVRALVHAGVQPERVRWTVQGEAEPELLAGEAEGASFDVRGADGAAAEAPPLSLPATVVDTVRMALLHADRRRFALLYRWLWRLQHEPALRHDDVLDADAALARRWAHAVKHEIHKMHAFVRFRTVAGGGMVGGDASGGAETARQVEGDGRGATLGGPLHIAWFEPEHHIVDAAAPFFVRRFANMRWAILTPRRCVHWDGQRLESRLGARADEAPPADAGEVLWLTYYRSIFNPARLKLGTMQREMPRRYWANLPEATLIGELAAGSAACSGAMLLREPQPTARRLPAQATMPAAARRPVPSSTSATARARPPSGPSSPSAPSPSTPDATPTRPLPPVVAEPAAQLAALRDAAAGCRECPIGALATQTVWGEGPLGAALMLVGEQPGDQEDLHGKPFVGPAGRLLAQALEQLGWDRAQLYVTNAVKHFKYEPRGKRRMHKTPAQKEADACLHWLESEIALVRPQGIVALGATAARQLMGRPVAVTKERGQWLQRADGQRVLVTLHPSALLRGDPAERDTAFAAWLHHLDAASALVRGAAARRRAA
jgi:DNA polymerase